MDHDFPDPRLARLLRAHHPPPPTPAEEMWDALAPGLRRRTSPVRRWSRRAALLAAALLLGIGIGRWSAGSPGPADSGAAVATTPPASYGATIPPSYRRALAGHLAEAQPVLAEIVGGAASDALDVRVRRLLVTTRVLLASPAARDPAAADLLRDLELVFAQAVMDTSTVLAADAMQARAVLPRVRALAGGQA